MIETYLRRRLEQRVEVATSDGKFAKGLVKPALFIRNFEYYGGC